MLSTLITRMLGRRAAWRLGRSIYMAARDEIGNDIATNGEAELIRLAMRYHRDSGAAQPFVAFDIGANLGEWTAALAEAAGATDWRVHLFEPVPGSFDRVAARFAGEQRVRAHQVAISDQVGTAEMIIIGETSGTNSLTHIPGSGGSVTTIRTTTIEAMLAELGLDAIDLVKIDIEGHDINVLRALPGVLASGRLKVVQFEYNWRWLANRGSLFEVFELVRDLPYRVARVYPGGPQVFAGWNAELDRYFEANYALIHDDVVARLDLPVAAWDGSNTPAPRQG